jgi:uncharacterized repeat protein (TIGR01451 family)
MLEHQASGKPIPVQAEYPDEPTTVQATPAATAETHADPGSSADSAGVVRMSRQSGPASSRSFGRDHGMKVMSSEGMPQRGEFQFVSYQVQPHQNTNQNEGPQFCPAEPRLECNPNGTPLYRMETVAASPLADLYPDEYVFDGGDRNAPVAMHSSQRSGLDTEDTVAAFTDHTGTARTEASNRVAVYAPRFGSIRTVTQLQADTKVDRAAGAKDNIAVGNLKTGKAAQENVHDTVLYGMEKRDRLDGMKGSTPPMQSLRTDVANQNRKVDEGHEGRAISGSDTFNRNDGIIISQQMQNAIVWTRDDFPVITASTSNASEISAKFKVQQTVGVEDNRRTTGNIHIVKLADRDEAQSGEIITFTIRFTNTGDFDVYDVRIVDNLTPRLEYVPGTAQIDAAHPGEVSIEPNGEGSSILTFTLDQPLKGHASGTMTFEARVK